MALDHLLLYVPHLDIQISTYHVLLMVLHPYHEAKVFPVINYKIIWNPQPKIEFQLFLSLM